jgi:hypothetical protein
MDKSENSSSSYKNLKVYISGYGAFMNIKNNPSQFLVESIIKDKNKIHKELEDRCQIVHETIYKVSCDYVSNYITNCHSIIENELTPHINS